MVCAEIAKHVRRARKARGEKHGILPCHARLARPVSLPALLVVNQIPATRSEMLDGKTWPSVFVQEIERQFVGRAFKIFEEGLFKDVVIGGSSHKQGHA